MGEWDSAKGLQESADQLSKTTGKKCLAAPADVRDQEAVKGAVEVANKEFGMIDFVICGEYPSLVWIPR
jgi:peroxisomal 2,4-dienoyl-CoA reductase